MDNPEYNRNSPVEVRLVFARSEAMELKKILRRKYNQDESVSLDFLCGLALHREGRETKVTLLGIHDITLDDYKAALKE